jgi:hypothetical protein
MHQFRVKTKFLVVCANIIVQNLDNCQVNNSDPKLGQNKKTAELALGG